MEFVTFDDITDKILRVEREDIDCANDYLTSLATRCGVVTVQQPIVAIG